MTLAHTCEPRANGLGLFAVELDVISTLGRRINVLGPYKSTWNNGCVACMIWKICNKTDHLVAEYTEMGIQWVTNEEMRGLRREAIAKGKGWMAIAFQNMDSQYVLTEKGLGVVPTDSVKAVMSVIRSGQLYEIARVTTSRSWQQPPSTPRHAIIKLPVDSFDAAKLLMDEAGFGNGFARPSLSVEQIEWQLREAFDPGIDLT